MSLVVVIIKWEAALFRTDWGVGALIMNVHLLDLVDSVISAVLTFNSGVRSK